MSEDVWQASAASLEEDFGPHAPEDGQAADAITIGHLFEWGIKLLQQSIVPLLIGGFAMWGIGFVASMLAQFANLGGSLAGAAANDPMMEALLGPMTQLLVQLAAAPFLWVAVVGIITAAAKGVVYDETEASAIVPSASSLLAYVVSILIVALIQVPFSMLIGVGAGIGMVIGGDSPDTAALYGAIGAGGALMIVLLPWMYVGLRLRFAQVAAIVEGSGIEGVKGSWEATADFSVLLHLLLFGLVEFGVAMVNVLLCCTFGLLTVITVPFFQGALTAAYIKATRPDGVLEDGGFFHT